MLKIGTLKLPSNIILAPMAGITDLPFRMINRKFGCEMAFVEMINVRSMSHKSKKTEHMLSSQKQDKPLGIQILGCEPKYIENALKILEKREFDLLDFNAACPARKVTKRGEGASLMRVPRKLNKLLKMVVSGSRVPVTVKIRSGWDDSNINARDVALAAQDAGINALFIHGRTRMQEYGGHVDYDIIRKVKKSLSIPVIASGDVFSGELAKKMFTETGCDGIIVARGALGNPWIFSEIKAALKNKEFKRPADARIIDCIFEHLDACIKFYGEKGGVVIFRKFFAWYTKGFRNVRHLRQEACQARTRLEMSGIIEKLI